MTTITEIQPASNQYLQMDERDENQILAEMKGNYVESFVYQYVQNGKTISNLSYVGIKEAIRKRGNFTIADYKIEETAEKYRAIVKVHDNTNNIDVLGVAESDKSKSFAYVLAVNKAERNAFAKLIPAKFFAELIAEKLNGPAKASVINIAPQQEQSKQAPKAAEAPAQAAVDKIKSVTEAPQVDWHTVNFDLPMEGLKQVPLKEGELQIGMMNIYSPAKDPEEITIVPNEPLAVNNATIAGWLLPKCLDAMMGITYTVYKKPDDNLAYIYIKGKFTDKQLKDINNGTRWAMAKALSAA